MAVPVIIDAAGGKLTIFHSTLQTLALAPQDRTISIVMRHSIRHPIIDPELSDTVELTEEGFQVAEEFGTTLEEYFELGKAFSSPVMRCVNTARAILDGMGQAVPVSPDPRLTHGFIHPAWKNMQQQPIAPGMTPEMWKLAAFILNKDSRAPETIDLYVTHDTILAVLLGYLLKYPVGNENWPNYLEGIAFWRSKNRVFAAWREELFDITDQLKRFPVP
jgi:broad specificity phosphatase PhoE